MRRFSVSTIVITLFLMHALASGAEIYPGVDYSEYTASLSGGTTRVYVVTMNRLHSEYKLEVGWPQKKRNFTSKQTTSSIASSYDNPAGNHDVIAAMNGSYFGVVPDLVGWPVASGGEILQRPNTQWDTLYFGSSRTGGYDYEIQNLQGSGGQIVLANGSTVGLQRYNQPADSLNNTAFTPQWDTSTRSSGLSSTAEIVLTNVSYPMRSDKQLSGIVSAIKAGTSGSNSTIPAGGMVVFVGSDSAATVLAHTAVGDRWKMRFATSSQGMNNADFAITGLGSIIHNGAVNTSRWLTRPDGQSPYTRQPMTVIAYSATSVFFVVCDGRGCNNSVGMNFQEMADFLIGTLGAVDAVDMDGGGSSTMWVNGTIKNVPSDGGCTTERVVANAIMLVKQNTSTQFPVTDPFAATGRLAGWDDKFYYCDVVPFAPNSPSGDGYVLKVTNPTAGVNTVRRGDFGDTNYTTQADIYCEYRPDVAADGYERCGLFAHDSGAGAMGLSTYGSGNCYALLYDSDTGRIRAGKYVNGTLTDLLAPAPTYITASGWHRFRIDTYNGSVRYVLDGTPLTMLGDTTFATGYFGVGYQSFFTTPANAHGTRADNFSASVETPPQPADLDGDGDVDQDDFGLFQTCFSGPSIPQNAVQCLPARMDGDTDVDEADFDKFYGCVSGANVPAIPTCTGS